MNIGTAPDVRIGGASEMLNQSEKKSKYDIMI